MNNDETALSKARDIRAQFPTVVAFKTWIADAAGKSPSRRSDDERFIITMMVRQPDVIEAAMYENTPSLLASAAAHADTLDNSIVREHGDDYSLAKAKADLRHELSRK